jgi:uncharacterized protein with GYD domain
MGTYVLLSSLTPEGRESLHKSPDRLGAVNEEIDRKRSHLAVEGGRAWSACEAS